jgi:hypothetical protein
VAGGTGHPGLWLLIGFMASITLSPTDVVQHCRPLGGSSIVGGDDVVDGVVDSLF